MDPLKPNRQLILLLALTAAAMLPTLMAIDYFDEVWMKRAQEAKLAVQESYEPNPYNVTNTLNFHVMRAMREMPPHHLSLNDTTRRELRGRRYRGPCIAYNPIDKCWRCQPNWHLNRKRLADCSLGFGGKATGGKAGKIYIVTDKSDDNVTDPRPGTLRHAVIQKEPLWIIFAKSMVIKLQAELIMQSNKTIDGRGANVHIAYGAGITIQYVRNIIIHGIRIHDIIETYGGIVRDSVDHMGLRTLNEGDGITVFGSADVWLDHLSMFRCKDGIIDVVAASTGVTISNGHFTDHNDVMLFGAHDFNKADKIMQVTLAFNHFGKRLIQRMPRCRWGFFHMVNNDYTHWLMYAIGGSSNPTIISQGNRFMAPPNVAAKEVTKRDYATKEEWMKWTWRSDGDLMMNGAVFVESGDPNALIPLSHLDMVDAHPASAVSTFTMFSGALDCKPGVAC